MAGTTSQTPHKQDSVIVFAFNLGGTQCPRFLIKNPRTNGRFITRIGAKEIATEAAQCVIAYAFEQLHAHRVVAFCHAENSASIRVMEKLGMQREGRLRETHWLNRAWYDEWVYAILEHEYFSRENGLPSAGKT